MKPVHTVIAALTLLGSVAAAKEDFMKLTSSAFPEGAAIPAKYTCEGGDVSPPLAWSGAPPGTKSFALIVDDPDAPDPAAPKMTWVHWVLYNIPADTKNLGEGLSDSNLPSGTHAARNDFRRTAYGGPCPPVGKHRYFFKLYALDTTVSQASSKAELEQAMKGHIVAQAQLMGTYQKRS